MHEEERSTWVVDSARAFWWVKKPKWLNEQRQTNYLTEKTMTKGLTTKQVTTRDNEIVREERDWSWREREVTCAFKYCLFCWKLKTIKKYFPITVHYCLALFICLFTLFMSHEQCKRRWARGKKKYYFKRRRKTPYPNEAYM